jgi:hypothetical protein
MSDVKDYDAMYAEFGPRNPLRFKKCSTLDNMNPDDSGYHSKNLEMVLESLSKGNYEEASLRRCKETILRLPPVVAEWMTYFNLTKVIELKYSRDIKVFTACLQEFIR